MLLLFPVHLIVLTRDFFSVSIHSALPLLDDSWYALNMMESIGLFMISTAELNWSSQSSFDDADTTVMGEETNEIH